MTVMKRRAHTVVLALAWASVACTPTFDWREVRPEGAGLTTLFPCKPVGLVRRIMLADTAVEMTLYACSTGGATYAVSFADIGDPQRIERVLAELAAAAARNVGSTASPAVTPLRIDGMTPNARAVRQAFAGQLGDGQRVQEHVAVFARGTRVFQATVVGAKLDGDAVDTFFGALRLSA